VPPTCVVVRDAGPRGRGVFATRDLVEGELVESCPVVVVPADQVAHVVETTLHAYHFRWGGLGEDSAIALGYGSLYNHSNDPNAMYVKKYAARLIDFVTLRAIAAGDEITVSYNGGVGDRSPVWFEVE
jgi:SET domain-containing protein